VARSYQPDPAPKELYDRLFREFVGLYRRNRKSFARLNREYADR
jgi:xylulokinase